MRIAFISYEAPPDTLVGGIGTYVGQAAKALVARGHDVEVFAGSPHRSVTLSEHGCTTHLIQCAREDRLQFAEGAGEAFASRHADKPFDVLEGPDFLADARVAKKLVPEIPLVVKLHTAMALVKRISRPPQSLYRKSKEAVKSVLQPVLRLKRWEEMDWSQIERPHALDADEIAAPCRDIADIEAKMWGLDPARISVVPYPFAPAENLLSVPVSTQTKTIGYVGRLEQRKGVIDLARAVPLVLKQFPGAKFLFAGATLGSPIPKIEMREYLEQLLAPHRASVTFAGHVPHERIHEVFAQIDIAVLPSLWENFPNSCLEAMSAARGVIGSSAGGMAEQLDGGRAGLLIPPGEPKQIADAICRFLGSPELRHQMGRQARERVLAAYDPGRIAQLMEESYQRAMQRARGRSIPLHAAA